MSTVATEPIPESYPAYQKSDSSYGERMLAEGHSQDIRHRYLPTNLPRARVVRGFFDSEDAENDYWELKHTTPSTTLEDELGSADLLDQYLAEFEVMLAETKATFQSYERRIEELHRMALDDEECSDINTSSKEDFLWLVKSIPWASKAALMLLDNGNLSAIWKHNKIRIEVRFRGEKSCEYVIFKQHERADEVTQMVGSGPLDGLTEQFWRDYDCRRIA